MNQKLKNINSKKEILILIIILVLGALLRCIYLVEVIHSPGFSAPQVDAEYHDYWARASITGDWVPEPPNSDPQIRTTPYFRPPGYVYFLSLVYLFSGSNYLVIRIVQMMLGLLTVFLAFLFGRKWFGSRMGLIFAGLISLYWGFIYFESDLLDPSLVTLLSLLLIWNLSLWIQKVTFPRSLLTGFLLGLLAIVRPNILLFAPVILIWAFRILKNKPQFIRIALGLTFATVLTIFPVTLRNYLVSGDFVLISANSGISLYSGNNKDADGIIPDTIPGIGSINTCYDYPAVVAAVEAEVGHPLKHSEVSDFFQKKAFEYIKADPLDWLKLTLRKALLFWGPVEVGNSKEDAVEREKSSLLAYIPNNFAFAFALFITGILIFLTGRKKMNSNIQKVSFLAILFIGSFFISYLPFIAAGRYRMPLVLFLFFFGASGIDWCISLAINRKLKILIMWLLILGTAYGLASINFSGYEPDPAKWHFDRGVSLAKTGKINQAIDEYRAALAIQPLDADVLCNLGSLFAYIHRSDEAVDNYQAALQVEPDHFPSLHALAKIFADMERLTEAAHFYLRALERRPSPAIYAEYGGVLFRQMKDREAVLALEQAIKLDPQFAPAHNNLALALFMLGDYAGAWRELRLYQKYGGTPSPEFLNRLKQRMAEP